VPCRTGKKYVRTRTSYPTGENVSVTYGSGYFTGIECPSSSAHQLYSHLHTITLSDYDTITLSPKLVITRQSIGDALQYADFQGVDGIIGVGPIDLTQGTLSPDVNAVIPTVINNAFDQHVITRQILGVSFAPATTLDDTSMCTS